MVCKPNLTKLTLVANRLQARARFPRRFDLWWSTIGQNLYISEDAFNSCQNRWILQESSVDQFAECILNQINSFSQIGLSSATAMLTIIPAGLALIPALSLGVDEAWELGVLYFLLSAFAGNSRPGISTNLLRRRIETGKRADRCLRVNHDKLVLHGWSRKASLAMGVIAMAACVVSATLFGLQTVLT